jgi:hypothetical protein
MLRTGILIALFALGVGVASAQSTVSPPGMRRGQWHSQVHVSVNVNMFVAAPTDSSPQALKAQEEARRKIYEIASHECAVLLDVMASDCQLENVNVNVNRYYNPQQSEGFNISGSMRLRVTPK